MKFFFLKEQSPLFEGAFILKDFPIFFKVKRYPSLFLPEIKFVIEKKKFEGVNIRLRPLIMGLMRYF